MRHKTIDANMQVQQQHRRLPIENLDNVQGDSRKPHKHGILLPDSFRAIFCGPSGCGKTNALLSLIFNENGLKFANIYLYTKTLFQPKYQLLHDVVRKAGCIGYFPFQISDEIIDPSEALQNSIFIFDDVACDKQNVIREFYSMGRHKAIDVVYLCQTYSKIPKQLIRDNCNVIVLFKQDDINLRHIYEEHVSPDITYDHFKNLCSQCWSEQYGTFVIVKDFELGNGRYRKGFDKYIKI